MVLKLSHMHVGTNLRIAIYSTAKGYAQLGVGGARTIPGVEVVGIRLWKEELFCFMGNLSHQHEPIHCFIPSRNGAQLRTICKDDSYDFNLQETRDLPYRAEIKPVGACGEA